MAIHDNDQKNAMNQAFDQANKQRAGAGATPPPTGQAGTTPPPNPNSGMGGPPPGGAGENKNTFSILDVNSVFSRPVSRQTTTEVVMQYKEKLEELLSRNAKESYQDNLKIVVVDNNTTNIGPLSTILVCYMAKVSGKTYIAVYTLLIEKSAGDLAPRYYNFGTRNVRIETVPGDVYNENLKNKITENVKAIFGSPQAVVVNAGKLSIPKEMEPEDDTRVRNVLFTSTQACFTVLQNRLGQKTQAFTIGEIDTGSSMLSSRLVFNTENSESATGEKIRSDVRVCLEGSLINQQQTNDPNEFNQVRELALVDAYIDLIYTPPGHMMGQQMPQQPYMGYPNPQMQMETQHYYPNCVITRADTQIDAVTMELQLLALAQTTYLSRNMAWAGVFTPRKVKGMDAKDIGAIGYEVNLTGDHNKKPEKVDTKKEDFTDQALKAFIAMNIRQKMLYSMDIEEAGEMTWINEAFIAAANGNQDGYNTIYEAADRLTNGHFSKRFGRTETIAIDTNNRIHLGYWIDSNNKRHDLREIDYLAMLNLHGKDDPGMVVRWAETYENVDIPMFIRLETRRQLYESVLQDNFHLKGYARRITLMPHFLESLNAACYDAGLRIRPDKFVQEFAGPGLRGNFQAGQYALDPNATSHLFATNAPNPYQGNQGVAGSFTGRFGNF